jgi:hypothetical protein
MNLMRRFQKISRGLFLLFRQRAAGGPVARRDIDAKTMKAKNAFAKRSLIHFSILFSEIKIFL